MSEPPPGPLPTSPQRLSPLSPIVRAGRGLIGLLVVLTFSQLSFRQPAHGSGNHGSDWVDLVAVVAAAVLGTISWAVTTWHVDGDTLQVSTGLIRRNTVRLPLSRIQAVDLVEPFLARVLGLAEVRVRTAGGTGGDARLMYLKLEHAEAVRASLLALVHGLPSATPAPPERPLFTVSNGRLVGSLLLTGSAIAALLPLALLLVVATDSAFGPSVLGVAGGTFLLDALTVVMRLVRRVMAEWDFEVAEAPDGLRIRSGLMSRVAETIPYGRVQAVRMEEPLLWRLFGWRRLELHLAGGVHRGRDQPSAPLRRALLPVGSASDAEWLLTRVVASHQVSLTPPPRRAMFRAPLSYHFLAAGRNPACAVSVSGRLRKLTEWVPLAKIQSIRYAQGPIQRWLSLASLHLDVAGRRASVRFLDRSADEAEGVMGSLPVEWERAREWEAAVSRARLASREPPKPPPAAPAPLPPQ